MGKLVRSIHDEGCLRQDEPDPGAEVRDVRYPRIILKITLEKQLAPQPRPRTVCGDGYDGAGGILCSDGNDGAGGIRNSLQAHAT